MVLSRSPLTVGGDGVSNPIPWFLLYGGCSEDGMGPGRYAGRTECRTEARNYLEEVVEGNPYSTGYVLVVSDEHCYMARSVTVFDKLTA